MYRSEYAGIGNCQAAEREARKENLSSDLGDFSESGLHLLPPSRLSVSDSGQYLLPTIGGLASRNSEGGRREAAGSGADEKTPEEEEDYLARCSRLSQAVVVPAMDAEEAAALAASFPVNARDGGYAGLGWEEEGEWCGAFCFVQAADTQFGMIDSFRERGKKSVSWEDEVRLTKKAVEAVNTLSPIPRFFVVCGDLVDAMPGISYKADQIRDLKACLAGLRAEVKPICVCGNHDIGDVPTPEAVAEYRRDFGDDHLAFWVGGVKFLVVNSQFYHDSSLTQDLKDTQDAWLDAELAHDPHRPWKHLVGLQHIPPFVSEPEEGGVDVPGNPALKFNFQNIEERRRYLARLKGAGMTKLFCGHYHRNAGGWDENLEVIVTSAIGQQLGPDTHGLRIVRVMETGIDHKYFSLDEIPESVSLEESDSL